ncbi:hypothetical protein ACIQJT_35480 [Streptomyces sp. NPDC091972]|uniref:hypothetical protein n=1 Tax=Streptomyces sp. NPDC091972 TaxID=3366007 RepID=UPI0037FCAC4B
MGTVPFRKQIEGLVERQTLVLAITSKGNVGQKPSSLGEDSVAVSASQMPFGETWCARRGLPKASDRLVGGVHAVRSGFMAPPRAGIAPH